MTSPFHIQVRQQKRRGERWQPIGEADADLSRPVKLDAAAAAEGDLLSVQLFAPPESAAAVRLFVGSVLIASTLATDRVQRIEVDEDSDAETSPLVCRGKLLADCFGITELVVEVRLAESAHWVRGFVLPLAVSAGKLEAEQFNQMLAELERDAAAVLLDVHGKTQMGLKSVPTMASSAPIAMLGRLRETIGELRELLHRMAREPASRLRTQLSREQALLGQAISETTLAEACRDPDLLIRHGNRLTFREHLREHSRPDFRIPEHQLIADFSEFLKAQLVDLRHRIEAEIIEREGRKRWRNVAAEAGKPTWWETEDWPRIEELQRCREEVAQLRGAVDDWSRLPFLPPGRCLSHRPESTPLMRNHAVYRRAFRVITGHFLTYQATLDTQQLLTRVRSLPVLYEWWCAVRVVRILSRGLLPLIHDAQVQPLIASRLAQEGRRFTIEFASDQAINFRDRQGGRVRFRYQPQYRAGHGPLGLAVVLLDSAALRTPDMALEVFPAGASQEVPSLIVVLDAKYSTASQAEKMLEVTTKYSKIGDARSGRVLSRQVWALTPAESVQARFADGLRRFCTVDNVAFWSGQFEVSNPVSGAVQTRPISPGGFDPLQALIVDLLKLAGVEYTSE